MTRVGFAPNLYAACEEPRAPARGFFKEKAFSAIHPRYSVRGILAFSRKTGT
jgi:hypothetical protein